MNVKNSWKVLNIGSVLDKNKIQKLAALRWYMVYANQEYKVNKQHWSKRLRSWCTVCLQNHSHTSKKQIQTITLNPDTISQRINRRRENVWQPKSLQEVDNVLSKTVNITWQALHHAFFKIHFQKWESCLEAGGLDLTVPLKTRFR